MAPRATRRSARATDNPGASLIRRLPAASIVKMSASSASEFSDVEGARSTMQSFGAPAPADIEEGLLGIVRAALGREVGHDESILGEGGHSLLALQIVLMARQRFGVQLEVASFLARPTLRGLSAHFAEALAARPALSEEGRCVKLSPG
jgi:hypothetical protein